MDGDEGRELFVLRAGRCLHVGRVRGFVTGDGGGGRAGIVGGGCSASRGSEGKGCEKSEGGKGADHAVSCSMFRTNPDLRSST